jgi:hypothetical protein
MNDTYSDFVAYLSSNMQEIRDSLVMEQGSEPYLHYQEAFRRNFHPFSPNTDRSYTVSATDSTEFVRELYSGKKLILIRAYSRLGEGIWSKFLAEVLSVARDDLSPLVSLLMEHNEHLSVIDVLRDRKPDFALIDGSLIGRFMHESRQINAAKYEDFMETYFSTLADLFGIASETGVPLVFVSKSSDSRMFVRYLQGMMGDPARKTEETDHLLVRSMARFSGYTTPLIVPMKIGAENRKVNVVTFHAVPDTMDLPIKVDVYSGSAQDIVSDRPKPALVSEALLNMIFWGYGGLKTHNIWLADVDRLVKFRTPEIENLYMKTFERMTGIQFYETRGERRARIRI